MKEIKLPKQCSCEGAERTYRELENEHLRVCRERDAAEAGVLAANRTIVRLHKLEHAAAELARYDTLWPPGPVDAWMSKREKLIAAVVAAANEEQG